VTPDAPPVAAVGAPPGAGTEGTGGPVPDGDGPAPAAPTSDGGPATGPVPVADLTGAVSAQGAAGAAAVADPVLAGPSGAAPADAPAAGDPGPLRG
jgi:hypothetical protein